jgi:protein ImuB
LVTDLSAVAALRAEPELAGRPFVVVSEGGPRATVLAVAPAAARAGVHRGDALAHARSVCANLVVRVTSPAREAAARAALLDVALSVSPRAEPAPRQEEGHDEAVIHLDVSGSGRLFPSEAGLAGALVARALALALPAVAAVAGSRAVATLAARDVAAREGPGTTSVVEPDGEPAFLAPLSLDLLHLDDPLAELLTRLGLRRVGQLLALPRALVASRLGSEATSRLAPLRGEGGERPIAAPRSTRIEEAVDFEAPLDRLEPLSFALAGLLSRLLGRLVLRHLACAEVELRLVLEPMASSGPSTSEVSRDVRRVRLAAPTADARTWLRRLRTALECEPPVAPVAGCALAAEGEPARRDQLDLFRPAGPAPAALDALLAELAALCGLGRIGAPHVPDDPRPGAFDVVPFEPHSSPAGQRDGFSPRALALRMLRPPLPATVRLCAGLPAWVGSAVASGDVVHCAGPWRTTGGWWSETRRFAFDSYDVATGDGLLVRLRYDHLARRWEIDALYD